MRGHPIRALRITAALFIALTGCAGARPDVAHAPPEAVEGEGETCPAVIARPPGSRLPLGVSACVYERLIDGSSLHVEGVPGVSFGGVAVWVEEQLGSLAVGLTLAAIPNLEDAAGLGHFAAAVRVDSVSSPTGEDLLDHDAPFAEPFFDRIDVHPDGIGPLGSHRLELEQPDVGLAEFAPLEGRRPVPLRGGVAWHGARVVGEVTLRLPLDVVIVEVAIGEPAVSAEGASISLSPGAEGELVLHLEGVGLRYAGHEPMLEGDVDDEPSCSSEGAPDVARDVREITCRHATPVERVRVAVARDVLERRFPFEITLD